jgi:hypothetical protein
LRDAIAASAARMAVVSEIQRRSEPLLFFQLVVDLFSQRLGVDFDLFRHGISSGISCEKNGSE